MSDAIVKAIPQKSALGPLEFTAEQRKMILNSFLNGASEPEAEVLLELARVRRLNPITRQIHFVQRWDGMKKAMVWAAQVGIDGFRTIAERTGLYDGQDEPEFGYDDKKQLKTCKVKVYRRDWSRPSVGLAHFSEYAQRTKEGNLTKMWAEKPHVMLAKCAEALAFRKAFPEDTSGLYAPEEMGEVPAERDVTPPANSDQPALVETGRRTAAIKQQLAARRVTIVDVEAGQTEQQAEAKVEKPALPALPADQYGTGKAIKDLTNDELAHRLSFMRRHAADPKKKTKEGTAKIAELEAEEMRRIKVLAEEPPLPGDGDAPF